MCPIMLRYLPLVAVMACIPLRAEIVWESLSQSMTATPLDKKISFVYKFKNNGPYVVRIDQPKATCVCTVATLQRTRYEPGDKGEFTGFYNINNKRGLNSVTIKINGEELDGESRRPFEDKLELKVFIPEIATVVPSITLWREDSEAVEKKIRIEVKQSTPLPLTLVGVSNDTFAVKLIEIDHGRIYDLVVTPRSIAEPAQGLVTLKAVGSDGKPLSFFAHLIVR